jgi:hypothetical protein
MIENSTHLNAEQEFMVTTVGELDPLGKDAHEPGAKLDHGKPRPALVLSGFVNAIADIGNGYITEPDSNTLSLLKYFADDIIHPDRQSAGFTYVVATYPKALMEVIKVGTFGAAKYTDDGWKSVPNGFNRYSDAMLRHIFKELIGETHCKDSGLLHAAHAAWNALARAELGGYADLLTLTAASALERLEAMLK